MELYINSEKITSDLLQEITEIKSGMNILRTNYELPVGKDFITPYWFLGFAEGVKKKKRKYIFFFFLYYAALYTEGSFFVLQRKNQPSTLSVVFGLYQTTRDLALMLAIKNFLHNLGETKSFRGYISAVSLFKRKPTLQI